MEVTSRTAKSWVELPGKVSTTRQRWDIVRQWVMANDFLPGVEDTHSKSQAEKTRIRETVYQAMDRGIAALRNGTLDVYQSINAMIAYMEKRGCSPTTISGHKFKLVKFYRYLKLPLDSDDLKEAVRKVDDYGVTDDRNFTREQIRDMLIQGTAKQKALISFMVCTGARRGEATQVKLSDIEWERRPVLVRFPNRTTKTHKKRFSFLSSESVELLKAYTADRDRFGKSIWLFDGWKLSRNDEQDRPLSPANAYVQLREAFAKVGLVPHLNQHGKSRQNGVGAHHAYHPHIFRSTSLEIMKSSGYPTDWAEYLVGHDIGTQESYLPTEDKMGEEWLKRCEPSFCFLSSTIDSREVSKRLDEIEKAVKSFGQEGKPDDKMVLIKDTKTGEIQGALVLPNNDNGKDAKRWSNHKWSFIKCLMESEDFDNALGDGYELYSQSGSLVVLRKLIE